MLFDDLANLISPFILNEKYHSYDIPTKHTSEFLKSSTLEPADTNKYLMYDFYMLDYLNNILDMPPAGFRDLNPDLVDSVKDAVEKLFPHLREELLNAVFYAICAEMRNSTRGDHKQNLGTLDKGSKERQIYADWLKYMSAHRGDYEPNDLEILGVDKPSSDVRPPELEKFNNKDRNLSYKAANYAIKKNGATRKDFVEMATEMFDNGKWDSGFGGNAWGRIGEGWALLHNSDKIAPSARQQKTINLDKEYDPNYRETPQEKRDREKQRSKDLSTIVKPMSVAIDHVYDLQHNTDTVFNKLKSYYGRKSGYSWIKKALDHKANIQNYYDLLKNTSGAVKSMALPVLHNKLGSTWEKHMKTTRPDELYDRAAEDKKQQEQEDKEAKLLQKLKDKKDLNSDDVDRETLTKQSKDTQTPPAKINKLYTPDEMAKLSKINVDNTKVGDEIVCITEKNVYLTYGETYIVKDINNFLVFIMDDTGNLHSYYTDNFRKAPESPAIDKFRAGDLVHRKGTIMIATVVSTFTHSNGDPGVEVLFKNGFNAIWKVRNTEKVIHPTELNSKSGDEVLCINVGDEPDLTHSKKYVISKIDGEFIAVFDDNGDDSYEYKNTRFMVIPQDPIKHKPAPTTYQIGDRVTYNTDKPDIYNGVVEDIKNTAQGTILKIHFKELQDDINIKADDPMLKKAPKSFKVKFMSDPPEVGDDVSVFSKSAQKTFFGKLISELPATNEGMVSFPAQHGAMRHTEWFKMNDIKKEIKI